jgi:DNA-binding response OmpR family regulator
MGFPLKILSVDDEPSIAQSMRFIFERPLYELASAQDGEAALARMAGSADPFDVVITDSSMPGVSGLDLVRALRGQDFPGKIMVLSAHLTSETRAAYEVLGVDALIEKPFNIKALRAKVDHLAAA